MRQHRHDSPSTFWSPVSSGPGASRPPQRIPGARLREPHEPDSQSEATTGDESGILRGVPEEDLREVALRIARLAVRYYLYLRKEETDD